MNSDSKQVWLVERTYSDDEQNLIILIYATLDGKRYVRKERALTSFSDIRPTRAAITVATTDLARVSDENERRKYAEAAASVAAEFKSSDEI